MPKRKPAPDVVERDDEPRDAWMMREEMSPELAALYVPLLDVRSWDPDPANGDPGNPNQGDVGAVYASVREFGFNGVLRTWNGICRAGNTSLRALMLLHEEGLFPGGRGLTLDAAGNWYVLDANIDHMSRLESIAFGLADNRSRDRASTDDIRLASVLSLIIDQKGPLDATGFDEDDVERMMRMVRKTTTPPEEFPMFDADMATSHECPKCGYKWN